jgi:hypothetical protein
VGPRDIAKGAFVMAKRNKLPKTDGAKVCGRALRQLFQTDLQCVVSLCTAFSLEHCTKTAMACCRCMY